MRENILSVADLNVRYGGIHALQGVTFCVPEHAVVALLGRNGAGKSTTLKAIMSIGPKSDGSICFAGREIASEKSYRIARSGIAYVPETRSVFQSLSVRENLLIAARGAPAQEPNTLTWTLERVFELFPRLAERLNNGGSQLSGGEQQMLSIARALMTNPKLLLLDEPTEGLAPVVVDQLERALQRLKSSGLSILLVEQNLSVALSLADEALVLGKGRLRWRGPVGDFDNAVDIKNEWLTV